MACRTRNEFAKPSGGSQASASKRVSPSAVRTTAGGWPAVAYVQRAIARVEHPIQGGDHRAALEDFDDAVEMIEYDIRSRLDQRQGPQTETRRGHVGDRGESVAGNVTDRHAQSPVGKRDHCVPVAADLGAGLGRAVTRRHAHARDARKHYRKQRLLQRLHEIPLLGQRFDHGRFPPLATGDIDRDASGSDRLTRRRQRARSLDTRCSAPTDRTTWFGATRHTVRDSPVRPRPAQCTRPDRRGGARRPSRRTSPQIRRVAGRAFPRAVRPRSSCPMPCPTSSNRDEPLRSPTRGAVQ